MHVQLSPNLLPRLLFKSQKVVTFFLRLVEKLKEYENQYMFIKWATGGEYGKLIYAGEDFIEFNVIDVDTMDYSETVLIHSPLILEVAIGGADVQRIVAEVSSKISIDEG